MFKEQNDTIAAIATPPGSGGIGIIRISGSNALNILSSMFKARGKGEFIPKVMRYGKIMDEQGKEIDEALAVFFASPKSYTGEDCAEIQCHGGTAVLDAVLRSAFSHGARMAERGEFTRRAFLNGKIDLSQAEAVAEIISAPSKEGMHLAAAKLNGLLGQRITDLREKLEYLRKRICLAVDFPDEESECLLPEEFLSIVDDVSKGIHLLLSAYERTRCWQEGVSVTLCGRVNAGKSSLMNALLGRRRAIVTDIPGTTRDYLEEQTMISGLPVRLTDTAGLREDSRDAIEKEGIRRGQELADSAQCILMVLDASLAHSNLPLDAIFSIEKAQIDRLGVRRCLAIWNKCDINPLPINIKNFSNAPILSVSSITGEGLEELCKAIRKICLSGKDSGEGELAPNTRQAERLRRALNELKNLKIAIATQIPPDICGIHLEAAASFLGEITGINTTEETLNSIFDSFCIGK